MIKGARLVGEVTGRVKTLNRFSKGRKEPDVCNKANARWVEEMGMDEVSSRATAIHDAIRATLAYRRKEVSFSVDGAGASINTPDFDVNITLTQHASEPEIYQMTTEVCSFRKPDVVNLPEFAQAFSPYCERVLVDLAEPLDIEAKIDEIEEVDALRKNLNYDAECTNLTLKMPEFAVVLHATPNRLEFTQVPRGDLASLLSRTSAAIAHLSAENVGLGGA